MKVDFSTPLGPVKMMHAINNGPLKKLKVQTRDNFDSYAAAQIPLARTHDAAFCEDYGGEHTVDVHRIFPCFDAPVDDPASYDFTLTDEYLERTLSAGTQIFYRLGARIEHEIKKYGTIPPRDFKKWAEICEHIILHMNEGWADGHHWNITYWEIWNEPDLDGNDTWNGTEAQFFDFFETVAVYLKQKFPTLKIGGPALAYNLAWAERFLAEMQRRSVPMDFFSWHSYGNRPAFLAEKSRKLKALLQTYGRGDIEVILNEWNYNEGWSGDSFTRSIRAIHGIKGAAYTAAYMLTAQNSPIDMLMYYDARPSVYNGLWDFYTQDTLPSYDVFRMFSKIYAIGCRETGHQVVCDLPENDLYALAAASQDGRHALMIAAYTERENDTSPRILHVELSGGSFSTATITRLDRTHRSETSVLSICNNHLELTMDPWSVVLLEF